jgi:hypothetical protein
MRYLMLLLLMLTPSSSGLGEDVKEITVQLPPVPDYPGDGKIPSELKDRFVFLDRKTGELVVSFPENLGRRDFENNPRPRITERVPLSINICPLLIVNVRENDRGVFSFEYRVENRSAAKQEIARWLLNLPVLEGLQSLGGPEGWMTDYWSIENLPKDLQPNFLESMTHSLGRSQLDRIKSDMIRKKVSWVAMSGALLPPGSVRGQFRITSQNKPGIVTAYFQGNPYMISLSHSFFPNETPPELGGQINVFNFAENNSVSLTTIGPRFVPGSSDRTVAEGFLSDIERLTKENRLAPGSAFSQEILSVLKFLVQQPAGSSPKQLIKLTQKPTTRLENQIYQAVQLSLSLSVN